MLEFVDTTLRGAYKTSILTEYYSTRLGVEALQTSSDTRTALTTPQ